MGEIRKINRETGEDMGVVGDIEANEIAGRPFICVYGVSRPRVAGEKKIVEKELSGGLKAYVRFETSDKLNATVGGAGSFVALEEALEPLGFASEDELWAKAIEATIAKELNIKSMLQFMGERMGIPEDMLRMAIEHSPMDNCYIVTLNGRGGWYGAGAMAVPCLMEQVREKIGNFYILPSSVHEIICIPESLGMDDIDELRYMVKTVNSTEVEPQDRLSDDVYYVDEAGLHLA
jgi:hypothetical protein